MGAGERVDVVAAAPARGRPRHARHRDARRRRATPSRPRPRPPPRLGGDVLRRPRGGVPRAADLLAGPWRADAERRDDARPVQDRPRRPRSTRPASWSTSGASTSPSPGSSSPSSRSAAPASGTGSTTARSRASSTPSRRSTSPPSPATCPPRPRSWATRSSGSRRPRSSSSAYWTMRLLEAAGLPPGVINLLHRRRRRGRPTVALRRPATWPASTSPARPRSSSTCGAPSAENIAATAPTRAWSARPAARTSSLAHPSADLDALATALVRGAFEYQGQKCSAASRAYVPRSVWDALRDDLAGDGRRPRRRRRRPTSATSWAPSSTPARSPRTPRRSTAPTPTPACSVVAGGTYDDSEGFFVRPTVVRRRRPRPTSVFSEEYFGPGPRACTSTTTTGSSDVLGTVDSVSALRPDRRGHRRGPDGDGDAAQRRCASPPGNFYVNDKPTGAVVGQQPFGGAAPPAPTTRQGRS